MPQSKGSESEREPEQAELDAAVMELELKQRDLTERLASFGLGDTPDPLLTSGPPRRARKGRTP